ncbi:hypothetical protein PG911_13880 [Tenacibaculum ovolyticum]|uniref:hypothetical protein n=1 Tax=Tenacibaculum ovolyticum TaxID=104270 RepID=UPI0007EE231E|nr:hypothetical protein [Tenacibaculum ovolyticum]WBX75736.1 hypothetical protein PG911_13880 [Tenacibaculum ovolyticum]
MKIINLYRIESKSFTSDLKKADLKTELINGFNLNGKRNFKSLFQKEDSDYQGTITDQKFKIKQNNALSSINDGIYFFFTQISGEIFDDGNKRIVKVNAELSEGVIGIILGSSPIYILILIFGNLWLGITCFLFLIFIYLFGIKNVKSDFEIFEQHLKQKLTVYNTVYKT